MAFEEYKNLWVFIETEEGKAKPVGYELLTPGRRLADANQEKLVAVVIGKNVEDAAKEAEEYGADEVILVDEDAYYNYNTDAFSDAMEQLIKKYKPSTVLIGATNNGRDMGPRLSCRLGTGLTADCTDLSVEEETGNIIWTRPGLWRKPDGKYSLPGYSSADGYGTSWRLQKRSERSRASCRSDPRAYRTGSGPGSYSTSGADQRGG